MSMCGWRGWLAIDGLAREIRSAADRRRVLSSRRDNTAMRDEHVGIQEERGSGKVMGRVMSG